jgi:hypothetical protein
MEPRFIRRFSKHHHSAKPILRTMSSCFEDRASKVALPTGSRDVALKVDHFVPECRALAAFIGELRLASVETGVDVRREQDLGYGVLAVLEARHLGAAGHGHADRAESPLRDNDVADGRADSS